MPKIWLALFIGYNGSTFSGMQFQLSPNITTIENVMIKKLYEAGFLLTTHHGQLQKQEKWSRAARTDKGVHAVINCVSCLINVEKKYFDEDHTLNRNRLYLNLKECFQDTQVVFHGYRRVTSMFLIRHVVKNRHYCYICPRYLFDKVKGKGAQIGQKQQKSKAEGQVSQIEIKGCKKEESEGEPKIQKIQNQSLQAQQTSSQILQKIRECCQYFNGSHNFHNYSKNLKAKDPQSMRFILNMNVQELDQDHLIFNIIGQSFIYHQIRKMVGCVIKVILNQYPANYIPNTFFRNQIHMPLAPAVGLFLNNISMDHYNKKTDIPEPLTFQGVQTIQQIRKDITKYIVSQNDGEWKEWIIQLRQSIYHGIEYIEDDKEQQQGFHGKGVLQD